MIHGDPMFKMNGKATHFWLQSGKLQALLDWKTTEGRFVLLGKTFDRFVENATAPTNQWFEQLVIKHGRATVLDVTAMPTSFGTMKVLLDGIPVKEAPPKGAVAMYTSSSKAVKLSASRLPDRLNIGRKHAEKLELTLGGMALSIYSSKAGKFDTSKEQAKFMHLNVVIQGAIQEDATGILAELSGAAPMRRKTHKLIERRTHALKQLEATNATDDGEGRSRAVRQRPPESEQRALLPSLHLSDM